MNTELDIRVLLPTVDEASGQRRIAKSIDVSLQANNDNLRCSTPLDLRSLLLDRYSLTESDLYAHEVLDLGDYVESKSNEDHLEEVGN